MRKLLVSLDDDLSKVLEKYPNQSETVRQALRLYIGDISTPDSLPKVIQSYKSLRVFMEQKCNYYDRVFAQLEKLIGELEVRM